MSKIMSTRRLPPLVTMLSPRCSDVLVMWWRTQVYAPSVHTLDGLEILPLPLCCHCAVAVCGDVLVRCWRLSLSLCCRRVWRCAGEMLTVLACCHCAVAGVRRCAGDVLAITAVWRCAGGEVGLAVLSLLVSMLLPSHSWRAMVSSSSRSMNMSTIV